MFDILKEYYGNTTVGERGQVVLPVKLRNRFKIKKGDKLLVLGGEKIGCWGVILLKAEVMTRLASKLFGRNWDKVLKNDNE